MDRPPLTKPPGSPNPQIPTKRPCTTHPGGI
nr:MAG TPA: hypothetical protein [Caudoviricetes sp.]